MREEVRAWWLLILCGLPGGSALCTWCLSGTRMWGVARCPGRARMGCSGGTWMASWARCPARAVPSTRGARDGGDEGGGSDPGGAIGGRGRAPYGGLPRNVHYVDASEHPPGLGLITRAALEPAHAFAPGATSARPPLPRCSPFASAPATHAVQATPPAEREPRPQRGPETDPKTTPSPAGFRRSSLGYLGADVRSHRALSMGTTARRDCAR